MGRPGKQSMIPEAHAVVSQQDASMHAEQAAMTSFEADKDWENDQSLLSGCLKLQMFPIFVLFFPVAGFPSRLRDIHFGYSRVHAITSTPIEFVPPLAADYMLYAFGLALYCSTLGCLVNLLAGSELSSLGFQDVASSLLMLAYALTQYPCILVYHRTLWAKAISHLRLSSYIITIPARLRNRRRTSLGSSSCSSDAAAGASAASSAMGGSSAAKMKAAGSKTCFLTAYDYYQGMARRGLCGLRHQGNAGTIPSTLTTFQLLRPVVLALLVAGTYAGVYADVLSEKHRHSGSSFSDGNALFGSLNILFSFLVCITAFTTFEYAIREVTSHGAHVREFAKIGRANALSFVAGGGVRGSVGAHEHVASMHDMEYGKVSHGMADAAIDFMWPENVVAWRHLQKCIVSEMNAFVDIAATLGFILGLAQMLFFIVSIAVEGSVYRVRPELVYLVQGFVCLYYGLHISRRAVFNNRYLKAVGITLQMVEADIVTESPVMDPTHLPFDPRPPDLSNVELPKFVEDLIHRLAENAHDVWSKRKLQDGWVYGEKNDVQKKEHTDLIHYKYLSCVTQSYDYLMVQETTKALYAMGYRVRRPMFMGLGMAQQGSNKKMTMPLDKKGKPVELPNGYVPAPVGTKVDDMPVSLMELNEALATHVHHKWARSRMDQGYSYGDKRCDDPDSPTGLRHPFLKRFEHLDDETKEANRNASAEILKTMSALGFKIVNAYATTSSLLLPVDQRRVASLRNIQSLQPIVASRTYQVLGCTVSNFVWSFLAILSVCVSLVSIVLLFVESD